MHVRILQACLGEPVLKPLEICLPWHQFDGISPAVVAHGIHFGALAVHNLYELVGREKDIQSVVVHRVVAVEFDAAQPPGVGIVAWSREKKTYGLLVSICTTLSGDP